MNNTTLSVSEAGGILMGVGLTQLNSALKVSLILIGAGVFLKVLVAVLNKYNVPVSSPPLG